MGRFIDFTWRRLRSGPIPILILSAVALGAASKAWEKLAEFVAENTGSTEALIYLLIAVLCAGVIVADLVYQYVRHPRALPSLPQLQIEQLSTVKVSSLEQLKRIQERLVPRLFGEATPPNERIYKMFSKNSHCTLALYSEDEQDYVGFATIWPLTDAAASKMMAGVLLEEQLTEKDILPASENHSTRFAIVPGVAVLDRQNAQGYRRGLKLMRAFRAFIADEYLQDDDRTMELLAVAYGEDGVKWCERLGMVVETIIHHGSGLSLPLYRKRIGRGGLRSFDEVG
jgi:hypothetical protein